MTKQQKTTKPAVETKVEGAPTAPAPDVSIAEATQVLAKAGISFQPIADTAKDKEAAAKKAKAEAEAAMAIAKQAKKDAKKAFRKEQLAREKAEAKKEAKKAKKAAKKAETEKAGILARGKEGFAAAKKAIYTTAGIALTLSIVSLIVSIWALNSGPSGSQFAALRQRVDDFRTSFNLMGDAIDHGQVEKELVVLRNDVSDLRSSVETYVMTGDRPATGPISLASHRTVSAEPVTEKYLRQRWFINPVRWFYGRDYYVNSNGIYVGEAT